MGIELSETGWETPVSTLTSLPCPASLLRQPRAPYRAGNVNATYSPE